LFELYYDGVQKVAIICYQSGDNVINRVIVLSIGWCHYLSDAIRRSVICRMLSVGVLSVGCYLSEYYLSDAIRRNIIRRMLSIGTLSVDSYLSFDNLNISRADMSLEDC